MLSIDLKNTVNKTSNNFTCFLMQLLFKADAINFKALASVYPIEANMVRLYKNDCSYIDEEHTEPDFIEIERRARELHNKSHEEKEQEP